MARRKADVKLVYLLAIMVVILLSIVAYLVFIKSAEVVPVVVSEEEAVETQQELTTSISDIKDDLEQLKKSLGK